MKPQSIISTSLICLLFCSQAFSQRISKDGIPPDYNCAGCILVILKNEPDKNFNKMNEMIEKRLIKNYDGKNIFVTTNDLDTNSQYADKNIYRFLLTVETYSVSKSMDKGDGRGGTFNYNAKPISLTLYNRLTKRNHLPLGWGAWSKTMENVAETLNKQLKK